jgi:hypothetical protein
MTARRTRSKVMHTLQTIGGWGIGFVTIFLFLAGLIALGFPGRVEPSSFIGHHRLLMGWLFLIVATPILILTMNRWIRALPGLLAAATLNALISFAQGHVINLPSKPISRKDALIAVLLFLGSTILSVSAFKGRVLNAVDRVVLLAFVSFVAWGILDESSTFTALSAAFLCLLFAWAHGRVRRSHVDDPGSTSAE